MRSAIKRSLALLFLQLTLLLILKIDQAQSFGQGGVPITESGRQSINAASSSSTFARLRYGRTRYTSCKQSLEPLTKIRRGKLSNDFRLNAVMDIVGVSPEPIHSAFAFATFGPQPFWLLMILLPGNEFTKKIMGKMGKNSLSHNARTIQPYRHARDRFFFYSVVSLRGLSQKPLLSFFMVYVDVVIFFALLHFFIVSASIVQPGATAPLLEFNDVFDPAKDSQAAFMNMVTNYPNFVAEEWPHVLTWDLFVGRYIWLDGLKRGG